MNNYLKKLSLLILFFAGYACAMDSGGKSNKEKKNKDYRASTIRRIIYTGCGGLATTAALHQFNYTGFNDDFYSLHFGLGVGCASLAGVYFAKAYQGKKFSVSYKSLFSIQKYFPGAVATTAGSYILAQATQRAMTEQGFLHL